MFSSKPFALEAEGPVFLSSLAPPPRVLMVVALYDTSRLPGRGELGDGSTNPQVAAHPKHGSRRRGVRGGHWRVREEGQVNENCRKVKDYAVRIDRTTL